MRGGRSKQFVARVCAALAHAPSRRLNRSSRVPSQDLRWRQTHTRPAADQPNAPASRWLLGLSNPRARFTGTRHNIGAEAVRVFEDHYLPYMAQSGAPTQTVDVMRRKKRLGTVARYSVPFVQNQSTLICPLDWVDAQSARRRQRTKDEGVMYPDPVLGVVHSDAFMNHSGRVAARAIEGHPRTDDQLLVVVDDLDLPLGEVRVRASGSHAGHNGLRSVFQCLGTTRVSRLRIGIGYGHPDATRGGSPPHMFDPSDVRGWVLGKFEEEELRVLDDVLMWSAEIIRVWLHRGVDEAANMANAKANRDGAEMFRRHEHLSQA